MDGMAETARPCYIFAITAENRIRPDFNYVDCWTLQAYHGIPQVDMRASSLTRRMHSPGFSRMLDADYLAGKHFCLHESQSNEFDIVSVSEGTRCCGFGEEKEEEKKGWIIIYQERVDSSWFIIDSRDSVIVPTYMYHL